jgi:hypothetical protein
MVDNNNNSTREAVNQRVSGSSPEGGADKKLKGLYLYSVKFMNPFSF